MSKGRLYGVADVRKTLHGDELTFVMGHRANRNSNQLAAHCE